MTALAFRFIQILGPNLGRVGTSATILTTLSAVGGAAAWLAGRQAANSLGAISGAAESVLSRHANLAGWTVLPLAIASILSLFLGWRRSRRGTKAIRLDGSLCFVALAGAVTIMMMTADPGGALVYRYGVAVATDSDEAETHAQTLPTGGPVPSGASSDDGSLPWNPLEDGGMVLNIDGSGLVTLPGLFEDVIVEATVDPAGFK